jgi:membrane complex biogenesis BtpA family protein
MSLPGLIGVIHLPALPGAPGAHGKSPSAVLNLACTRAVEEAKKLEKSGFEGLIIENFGDAPFYKNRVPPETVSSMSIIASAVISSVKIPLGINVLRNDADAALAVASVTGAAFVRINVLAGVVATDQGLIEGEAARWVRENQRLGGKVRLLADVHVKHAQTLSSEDLGIAIEEVAGRGGADGVIVTGATTGRLPAQDSLRTALSSARHSGVPLYVGSGMTVEGLSDAERGLRLIVGSALRRGGKAGAPLDPLRISALVKAWRGYSRA